MKLYIHPVSSATVSVLAPLSASPAAAPAAAACRPAGAARRLRPAGGAPAVPAARLKPPPSPEALHPALWLGHQLGRSADPALSTGFAALDAQLPGRGWPRRALTELLLPHPGVGEIRLLAPSLAAVQRAGRLVMVFDPPARLSAWALSQWGLDVEQLLLIGTRTRVVPDADSLWALEQALRSGHVGAVLAWLPPRLRAEHLRRLQVAAQAHDGPAFLLRDWAAQQRPTAAPLRLALRPAGADALSLRLLKRRGPPLEASLRIDLPPVLPEAVRGRAAGTAAPRRATRRRCRRPRSSAWCDVKRDPVLRERVRVACMGGRSAERPAGPIPAPPCLADRRVRSRVPAEDIGWPPQRNKGGGAGAARPGGHSRRRPPGGLGPRAALGFMRRGRRVAPW